MVVELMRHEQAAGRGNATMRPVYVGENFGWLHTAGAAAGGDVAVLVCPGLIRDRLDAHHGLRLFADALALAGYPAMRFDYPGTGDAAEATGEPWAAWLDGVHAAADWLRAATGARRVVLVGLRVGATLASLVAERRDDVAALALLAPVLRGRSYLQQLQIEARLQRNETSPADRGIELHEVCFGQETIERLTRVDLRHVRLAPGTAVGMFLQAPSKPASECAAAWGGQGSEVAVLDFAGLEPLLRHNDAGEGEPPDFAALLSWLCRTVPARPMALPTAQPAARAPELAGHGWIETPRRFGAGLFGVLCSPARPHGDLAVLIGNTGRDPHYGVARFGTEFARHLATLGVPTLRFDFAGIGDSSGPAGKEDILSAMLDTDRGADIASAIDLLSGLGYRRIVMQGNCSGAYHALRAAVDEPRVTGLLLLNLPVFEWQVGETPDFMHRKTMKLGHYLARLVSREDWLRLLRGRFDLQDIVRAQARRAFQRVQGIVLRAAERHGWIPPQSAGRRALRRLALRGVRALFLFASDDNGIDAMEQEFGRGASGLVAYPNATLHIESGLDHLLSTGAMRWTVIDLMSKFLIDQGDWVGQRTAEYRSLSQEHENDGSRNDSYTDGKHRPATA